MYDPFGLFENDLTQPAMAALARPRAQPFKDPEEEQSALGQIAGVGLGGLGWIGSTIDKLTGARAIRSGLHGLSTGEWNPRELLSYLPGTDMIGLTNQNEAISGDTLAKDWGVIDEGTKGEFEMQDLVGPALEIALDPTTYMSFGASALTKAGKLGKRIGVDLGTGANRARTLQAALGTPELLADAQRAAKVSGDDLAQLLGERMGGDVGFGLPFMGNSFAVDAPWMKTPFPGVNAAISAAPYAAKIIPGGTKMLEAAGAAKDWAGSQLGALFDKTRRNQTEDWAVKGARFADAAEQARTAEQTEKLLTAALELQQAGEYTPESLRRIVYEQEQGLTGLGHVPFGQVKPEQAAIMQQFQNFPGLGTIPDVPGMNTPLSPVQAKSLATFRDILGAEIPRKTGLGIKSGDYGPNYWPQGTTPLDDITGTGGRAQPFSPFDTSQIGRQDLFANLTREHREAMVRDPVITGTTDKDVIAGHLLKQYLGIDAPLQQALESLPAGMDLPPQLQMAVKRLEQGKKLGDYFANSVDPRRFEQGFYSGDPIRDLLKHVKGSIRAETTTEGLLHGLADIADLPGAFERGASTSLLGALQELGLGGEAGKAIAGQKQLTNVARNIAGQTTAGVGEARDMLQPLSRGSVQREMELRTNLIDKLSEITGRPPEEIAQLHIPRDAAEHINSFVKQFDVPDAAKGGMGLYDEMLGMAKRGWTSPWPAFTGRNIPSGMVQGAISGNRIGSQLSGTEMMRKILAGDSTGAANWLKYAEPGFTGTDKQAADRLRILMRAHNVTSGGAHAGSDITEQLTRPFVDELPGAQPYGVSSIPGTYANMIPRSRAEWKSFLPSWLGGGTGYSPPVREGQKLAGWGEDLNRGGTFLAKLQEGYNIPTAARETRAAQVDYGGLANFEKNVMRRLVPFYTYQSRMLPYVGKHLLENPGGPISMLGRFERGATSDSWLPEYMTSGLAIPLGGEDDGTQRYLTRLGLPQEQIFDWIKAGPKGGQNTLMGLLGELNPLLKAPLEWSTGKQFFTGRDLEELESSLPVPRTLEHAIMNSPLARLSTTVRQLTDPRKDILAKAANLLTGVKVSDVDMAKQRDMQARRLGLDVLGSSDGIDIGRFEYPQFEPGYVPTPGEEQIMRLLATIQKRKRDQKAQERKMIGVMP